jgi:acyl dehydratase
VVTYVTRPDQALFYRLSGDRNPLHSDPEFARRAGFERPILHGLCTYGFTGRALLHALCGSDPRNFGKMAGRFTRPVEPGDTLDIAIWREEGGARYRTSTRRGAVAIDWGIFRFAGAE